MVADTVGFPLLPQGRGLEGAWPSPAAQQIPTAGAGLGGCWPLGLWYEGRDPGCPLWKLSEVVGEGCSQ